MVRYDKDGTKLLQPEQKPYTAIGELYGQFRLTDEIVANRGPPGIRHAVYQYPRLSHDAEHLRGVRRAGGDQ